MPKRRRERDRPKAGPEAAYNPNKRVLLSYDSDDELEDIVEPATNTELPAAADAAMVNYQFEEYPDDDQEVRPAADENDGTAVAAEEIEQPEEEDVPRVVEFHPKRRDEKKSLSANRSTGQFPALGLLSFQYDEDVEEEKDGSEQDEAMAYLRAVRAERQALPTFFSSSKQDIDQQLYDNGVGDSRGYVDGDAFIGAPDPVKATCAVPTISPQEAYTAALRERFLGQRSQLHQPPSESAIAALSRQHPIFYNPNSMKQYNQWTRLLNTIAPLPAQVRQMKQETCFDLLHLLSTVYLTRETDIRSVTSAWVWSLLARLDDVGTMDNDQVFSLRELGKKAVLVQLSFTDPEAAQQLEALDSAGGENMAGSEQKATELKEQSCDADGEAVQKTGGNGQTTAERENTMATLDMMLTIIGEVFGQRDLLEFRRQWHAAAMEDDARNG
ncbi:Survival motor neuron (SMN) interacting protein 1 (SIP1) [Teratosphaeria destructans]|uniref:Survival motor neuron (SMN) interacting protein 1 (SIP1) n=1 Tax=Teratosphaeria destructans TaxID=418781 RepID=A0A9W7SPY2_9PEZI|nr:Survival motor neuron (SMN) interacting protein 1 (SIP1) [Teratosphaeria destructans]